MSIGALGKLYDDGEEIIRQGAAGNTMYVVQQGLLEVLVEGPDGPEQLSILRPGDIFGEMSLFTRNPRTATVRARGPARVLTIDKRGFFKRVQEDPTLAFRILQKLSERVQELNDEVVRLRTTERARR